MTARGAAVALLEIAETFVWLGAACRTSEHQTIDSSVPRIHGEPIATKLPYSLLWLRHTEKPQKPLEEGHMVLGYRIHYSPTGFPQSPYDHCCWEKLFRNPVLAHGYPINRREHYENGLEIPIQMAAAISHAQYATTFDGSFLLKGFCSALIPTFKVATSITWHYLLNDDETRMSYNDICKHQILPVSVDFESLSGARHFVGWTPNAQLLTGT